MNPLFTQALHHTTVSIFNAYSPVALADCLPGELGPQVAVAVDYSGPHSGHLELQISRTSLVQLATHMFARQEPVGLDDQIDAIREITNIVTGNLLSAIEAEPSFDLGLPRVLAPEGNAESNKAVPLTEGYFALGSGMVRVALYRDK